MKTLRRAQFRWLGAPLMWWKSSCQWPAMRRHAQNIDKRDRDTVERTISAMFYDSEAILGPNLAVWKTPRQGVNMRQKYNTQKTQNAFTSGLRGIPTQFRAGGTFSGTVLDKPKRTRFILRHLEPIQCQLSVSNADVPQVLSPETRRSRVWGCRGPGQSAAPWRD